MSNYTAPEIIQQTKNWVERIVVGFNFCPFAKREVLRNSIRYLVSTPSSMELVMLEFVEELKRMDADETIETTLIIYPKLFGDFEEYLDLVDMGQSFLQQLGYEGTYQLASFHPKYCFADVEQDDASNFTNRSPYPTLHLIREKSIERALEHYDDPESIPDRNIAFAREKGREVLQKILLDCYQL